MLIVLCVLGLIFVILYIVAGGKIYKKLGEGKGGGKCLIPIYSEYYLFKKTWRIRYFIFKIILSGILGALLAGTVAVNLTIPLMIPIIIVSCLLVLIELLQLGHISKSFGHSVGYVIGLIFLNVIFVLILGLGSSKYVGNSTYLKVQQEC